MNKSGVGTRTLNFLIDTLLILLIAYFVNKLHPYYISKNHIVYIRFHWIFWSVLFIYYTLFESILARTPGKFLSYTKVVNSKGDRPNILQVVVRSVIRLTIIDMFFFPFFEKMLHDKLSNTDVVEK